MVMNSLKLARYTTQPAELSDARRGRRGAELKVCRLDLGKRVNFVGASGSQI